MASSADNFDHIIVWLDKNIAEPDCCRILKKAFSTNLDPEAEHPTSINDTDISHLIQFQPNNHSTFQEIPFTFKLFNDIEACDRFLLANADQKRIFFITSGALGQYIVPKLLNYDPHVFQDKNGTFYKESIYVFCADMRLHYRWTQDFMHLECIQMGNDERLILCWLMRDIAYYLFKKGEEEINVQRIEMIEKGKQHLTWGRALYDKADRVKFGVVSINKLKEIDKLIDSATEKISQIQKLNTSI